MDKTPVSKYTNRFMATAQIPYLNSVIIASASNNLKCFPTRNPIKTKTKNKLAVGLSGTNAINCGGVSESCLSINELRVISASYEKALDAVENDGMSYEDRIDKVTQFRLVVDAILSEHQPLWSTMEEPIMTTFAELKTEMEKEDWAAFQHEWNRFLSLYSVIYPSLTVDVDSKNIDKIETHISAVNDKMFFEISKKTRQKHMMEIEKDLKNIFDRVKNDEADPSLLWVMFTTGSVIFIALAYTGWKKYKGEKTDKRKEN